MGRGILDSTVIVDLTSGLAGPLASRLLAEHGADVIKVEPPAGDLTRGTAAFSSWNRSKRSVVIDLRTQQGRARLNELLAGADVVMHGFTPSKAKAFGLDVESLAERFPGLISSTIPGYPSAHADAERSGHDILVQARSGAMDEDRAVDRDGPVFLRLPVPSWAAAYLCAAGTVAQLLRKAREGSGGAAETSVYQAMLAVLSSFWARAEHPSEALISKFPNFKDGALSTLTMFRCADGRWIHVLFGFVEHPLVYETMAEMGEEPPVVEGMAPSPPQLAVYRTMFARRGSGEWLEAFHEGDVPAALVEPLGTVFNDDQAIANDYVVDLDDPTWGRVRQAFVPFRIGSGAAMKSAAPALGEHNDLTLAPRSPRPGLAASAARPPLAGVKVLDVGAFIAGPLATVLLAELGADVIKVEPLSGDPSRRLEGIFLSSQRGKRSLSLDLQHEDGRSVMRRLLCWADVLHHNMRAAATRKLGLDPGSVAAVNPRLITSDVSAYGHRGRQATWPGYEPIAFAQSGWEIASAPGSSQPMPYRLAPMDITTAMASTLATVLALLAREATGRADQVETSLLGVGALMNSETMLLLDDAELAPYPAIDRDQTGVAPGYRIYRLADDQWIAVAALRASELQTLVAVSGATGPEDVARALLARSTREVVPELEQRGVAVELVRRNGESVFFDSPDNAGLVGKATHPGYGLVEQPARYWTIDGRYGTAQFRPAPLLGEHSTEILGEVGFSPSDIDALIAAQVVKQAVY